MKRPGARVVVAAAAMLAVGSMRPAAVPQTSATASTPQASTAAPAGHAENGRTLFRKNACSQCHGYEGQGGTAGPRLGPGPIPFRAFVAYVRAPREEMPPYTAKVMSDEQLADVYAFLQSRPRPPAVENIPLLAR